MSLPRPLLVEKYRPKTLEGYVFQDKETEATVRKWIASGEIPNILLTGGPGSGKSTLARILVNEFDIDPSDVKKVNASLTNGIGFIRDELEPWMKKMKFSKFKVVLLEECDQLTQSSQKSLRDLIESHSSEVRFIMTANYPKQIIDALHSRMQHIDMKEINMDGIVDLVERILDGEGIDFDDADDVIAHIEKYAPDIRKIINSIDECTDANKKLRPPKSSSGGSGDVGEWIQYFSSCDKVVLDDALKLTSGIDGNNFELYYETMYTNSSKFPDEGNAVVLISQYLDRAMSASNQRLHLDAFLYHIFMEV